MNRKIYEALYLRLQSKALEHYEIARQLLAEGTTVSECSHLLDELEKHVNGCATANQALQLLRDQFQEQVVGHQQRPSTDQRWDSLMERLDTLDQRLKPAPHLMDEKELMVRSSTFRSAEGGLSPMETKSDDNENEE